MDTLRAWFKRVLDPVRRGHNMDYQTIDLRQEDISRLAIIAQDGDKTVGRVYLCCPLHVEGIWVEENSRGGLIGHLLMMRAEEEAKKAGATKLLAYGASEKLEDYLSRLGYTKMPLTVWEKEL